MSRMLLIDTSDRQAQLEAWDGDGRIGMEQFGAARHVQGLTSRLKSLLKSVNWSLTEIDAMAVNVGPGSFTGIRVALATVKAIVYVGGQKLIGVDNFDAWASGVPIETAASLSVVMEGQLQTVNVVHFHLHQGTWNRGPLITAARDQLDALILDCVTGPSNALKALLGDRGRWIDCCPNLGEVARRRFAEEKFDEPMSLEPYYVRPSSAEEKWDAGKPMN